MRNKGQMFLITAAIIIVILVVLKTGINLPNILQREKELQSRFEKEFFLNIVDELIKVIHISYHQSNNITTNVFDFGNFTRKKMTERLQSFEFLYVSSITPASSGNDTMNVTVINLLNEPISATLWFNNSGGAAEMIPTYANDSSGDVTADVNDTDNQYADESCSEYWCSTDSIFVNFTTSETYESVKIEWRITEDDPPMSYDYGYLKCWNGSSWSSSIASTASTSDVNDTASLSSCDNSDGNYTFKVYGTDGSDSSVTVYIDYIWINRTGGDAVKSSEMADSSRWDTNFSITQGDNYILTVGYNGTYSENISIQTKVNKFVYVGFFDITLIGSETTYKDRSQKSYTLPPVIITTTITTTTLTTTTTTVPTNIPTQVNLYLNGSEANIYYLNQTTYNFTAVVNVTGVPVNLTTNMTGWADQSGITSVTNISTISCNVNDTWYNVTGWWEGNATYLSSSATHYAICYETTTTTTTTVPGACSGDMNSCGSGQSDCEACEGGCTWVGICIESLPTTCDDIDNEPDCNTCGAIAGNTCTWA